MWNHWLWEDKPFSKGQAWIDMLLLMNHETKKVLLGNELIEVKRGEHITSEYILADRWGWSRKKVRNFLQLLVDDGMIENLKEDKKRTRLRVCNYNDYQISKNYDGTTMELDENYAGTSEELLGNLNNNDNNYNNENNMLSLSISESEEETSRDIFPNFYQWIEKKNYTEESKHPNDQPYYLKYLHEKANFNSKTKGKEHPETISAIKTFESKKANSTEEVILKAQNIS